MQSQLCQSISGPELWRCIAKRLPVALNRFEDDLLRKALRIEIFGILGHNFRNEKIKKLFFDFFVCQVSVDVGLQILVV